MSYRILNWDKYQGWKSEQKQRPENAPPYPWLKLHRKTLDSMDFFAIPEPIRWQWFALLCLSDDNGTISESDTQIAWRLRLMTFDAAPFMGTLFETSDISPMKVRSESDSSPTRREEKREEEIREDQSPPTPQGGSSGGNGKHKIDYQRIADQVRAEWNTLALKNGFAEVRSLEPSSGFWKAFKARASSKSWLDQYPAALEVIPSLGIARSGGARPGWKPNFEWFIRTQTVDRIVSGGYDRQTTIGTGESMEDNPFK